LLTSGYSTTSTSFMLAQSWLPASMATGVSKELDKYTAQVEAETRIPLSDLLATIPDSHQTGWVTLRRCLMTGTKMDCINTQLWMQVYVLPDNQSLLQMMNDDYVAEGVKLPDFRASLCTWRVPDDVLEEEETSNTSAAPTPSQLQSPPPIAAPAPIPAVVPPGVSPGQMFSVNGPPTVHQVKCPAGLHPGDTWQALTPTGQAITVQIPPGVLEGQIFQVQVPQVLQVQCPQDAPPGTTIMVQVHQAAPQVMQVTCPADTKSGDAITVVVPGTGQSIVVQVPPGVEAGQPFAVQIPPPPEAPAAPAAPLSPAAAGPTARLRQLQAAKKSPAEGYVADSPAAAPLITDLLTGESPSPEPAAQQEMVGASVTTGAMWEQNCLPADLFALSTAEDMDGHLLVNSANASSDTSNMKPALDWSALYQDSQCLALVPVPPAAEVKSAEASVKTTDKFAALELLDELVDSPPRQPALSADSIQSLGASEPPESFQALQASLLTGFSDSYKPRED